MIKGPKYWKRAEMFLNYGARDEVVIEQMITDDYKVSREEAITAIKYARSQGAGKAFEWIHTNPPLPKKS